MSEVAMIPTLRGRPSVVRSGNCSVYVSVHDAEHLRLRREWKRKLAYYHHDAIKSRWQTAAAGGACWARQLLTRQQAFGATFRQLQAGHEAWLRAERVWYARLSLEPPEWG